MTITEHVGNRIRMYRKHRGLTLTELAEKLNYSSSTISKYENGLISIDIETVSYTHLDVYKRQLVDLAGVEPASESPSIRASPITVIILTFPPSDA